MRVPDAYTTKPLGLPPFVAALVLWRERRFSFGEMKMTANIAYRRKPRTIHIGKIEITEPVREPLQNGENYFVPAIDCGDCHANRFSWDNDSTDKRLLKQGVVHLTTEDALSHARALLALTAK